MEKKTLAIVIPCFNEEEILQETFDKLYKILQELKSKNKISENSFISFVDDGSSDSTWNIIKNLDVKGLKFDKNYGQQKALYAGLVENEADMYITMDADLQDDISLIELMVDKYSQGFELVFGVRNDRKVDDFLKRFLAESYYFLCSLLKRSTIKNHAEYRLISKNARDMLKNSKKNDLYLRGFFANLNLKMTKLYYKREERIGGTTKYSFLKSLKLAIAGLKPDKKDKTANLPFYTIEERFN